MEKHGREGHLSTCILDQRSVVTGFGTHARVVAFHPDAEGLYIRVDLASHVRRHDPSYPDIPEPTADQILSVARKDQGVRGKWRLRSREVWPSGNQVDYWFSRV